MPRNKSAVTLSRTEILMPERLKGRILDSLEALDFRTLTDFVVAACEKALKTPKRA